MNQGIPAPELSQQPHLEEPESFSKKPRIILLAVLGICVFGVGVAAGVYVLTSSDKEATKEREVESTEQVLEVNDTEVTNALPSNTPVVASTVDITNLPLGDDRYSSVPKKGYVYSCKTTFNGGGAFTQGPWINSTTGTWDLTKKVSVDGEVSWANAAWSISLDEDTRSLVGNNLPRNHATGAYPIASTDDAYQYDRNPNSISVQDIKLEIPATPVLLDTPRCVGGEVGVMLSGVLLFNAFDAGGRDAVATEVQDTCQGHPQEGGYYHYHGWSGCLEDGVRTDQHSSVVGYAFDGFGIFGLQGEGGIELSSENLDECHGHSHKITWDSTQVDMYHYHMTQDFPYSVGCFRGDPVVNALSQNSGSNGGNLQPSNQSVNGPGNLRLPPPPR